MGRAVGLLVCGLALALAPGAAAESPTGLLVSVGEVTDREAVLWARGLRPGPLVVSWETAGGSRRQGSALARRATDLTARLRLTGLSPGQLHRYTVSQGGLVARGAFRAAPHPGATEPVRFLWSGDLGSRNACRHAERGYPIFGALREERADFFLFVGDTIYADHACGGPDRVPGYDFEARTLQQFHAKHRYNLGDPGVQAFLRGLGLYAIWDDHEVRNDFVGPAEPLMPLGRQAFLDYYPLVPPPGEPTRLYRRFRWGQLLEVFILDTRQYRSPNADPDGPGKTMLGPAQRRWLLDGVTGSETTWKVIVSTVSLSIPTGRLARDSWSNANLLGFPQPGAGFAWERDLLLRTFRERRVRNLVVVAADVHHAEVLRHRPFADWSLLELVAGPLSASLGRPRPVDQGLGPESLFALGGVENFGAVTVDQAGLTVRIVDVNGFDRFTRTFPPER